MKLEAKRKKSSYKSTDSWLDAVYKNNKEIIDQNIITLGKESKKTIFKQLVKENMAEGMSPVKALKTLSKSTVFTPVGERLINNAYKGLKSDKGAYKAFRELTKENGRYTKLDLDKFRYDPNTYTYVYDNRIRISFENSPKQTVVDLI